MKAKENVRIQEVWDIDLSAIQMTATTDWDVLTSPKGGQSTTGYKDVAIRVLLEICGVDPDLYKGLSDTITSCHDLRSLVLQAVKNMENKNESKNQKTSP